MSTLADLTDPRWTDEQRAVVARFDVAPFPAEVLRERVARAICEDDRVNWEDPENASLLDLYRSNADAAIAAIATAQTGVER